ncbi:ribosomal protein L5 domain-containing protein [Lipomyces japonicus]|uniref:mitochondrial 54S ribosomal protein uL5m n=1 Tax=Lipomyces japonicus TaxID=56871 RepID=UPI0034CF28AE
MASISCKRSLIIGKIGIRRLHTTAPLNKSSISIVHPVHHRIRFKKSQLKPAFKAVDDIPRWDTKSNFFKPHKTEQNRLEEHYHNTLAPDLLLANYVHDEKKILGNRMLSWDGSSPYHINRPQLKPAFLTPDIHPRTFKNIARVKAVTVHSFVDFAADDGEKSLPTASAIQQITGKRTAPVFAKQSIMRFKLRKGTRMGARVTIEGPDMNQFLATLIELVLPRIKGFPGISNTSGDKFGNISFGLKPEALRFFPEIDGNPDLWPRLSGIQITLHTTAQTDPEARILLSAIGFPFHGRERFIHVPNADTPRGERRKGIVYPEGY